MCLHCLFCLCINFHDRWLLGYLRSRSSNIWCISNSTRWFCQRIWCFLWHGHRRGRVDGKSFIAPKIVFIQVYLICSPEFVTILNLRNMFFCTGFVIQWLRKTKQNKTKNLTIVDDRRTYNKLRLRSYQLTHGFQNANMSGRWGLLSICINLNVRIKFELISKSAFFQFHKRHSLSVKQH